MTTEAIALEAEGDRDDVMRQRAHRSYTARRDQLRALRVERSETGEAPAPAARIMPKAIRTVADADRWLTAAALTAFMSHAGGPQPNWAHGPHRDRIASLIKFKLVEVDESRRTTSVPHDARELLCKLLEREIERFSGALSGE